jgi:hypothetical protein
MILFSCQKEVTEDISEVKPPEDSIWLVSTIHMYEDGGPGTEWLKRGQVFDYDIKNNKTFVVTSDTFRSSQNQFIEIFSYDKSNRLSLFETTDWLDCPCTNCACAGGIDLRKIEFFYKTNGDLEKALIYYKTGDIAENTFDYSYANGMTTVTMYDSSHVDLHHDNERPRVVKTVFDQNKRIVSNLAAVTDAGYKEKKDWYKLVTNSQFTYDGNSNVQEVKEDYTFIPGNPFYPMTATLKITREPGKGIELYNSYLNLYRNLYWFTTAETQGFAEALMDPFHFNYQINPPVKIAIFNSALPLVNDPGLNIEIPFQNTYDANNLLVKVKFQPNYDPHDDNRTEVNYTYKKVRK